MLELSFIVFLLSCVTVFISAARLYGLFCWGTLVVGYAAFMLLIFPAVAYVFDFYASVPHVIDNEDITYLYLMMSFAMIAYLAGYHMLSSTALDKKITLNVQKYGIWVASEMAKSRVALLMFFVFLVGSFWSLQFGYFGLSNRGAENVAVGAGLISLVSGGLLVANIVFWVNGFEGSTFKMALISLVLCLVAGAMQNSKGAMAVPLIQVVLAYYFVNKRMPWLVLISIGIVFIGLIVPLIQGFRYAIYFNLDQKSPEIYAPLFLEYFLSGQWLSDDFAPEGERALSFGRGIFHYMVAIFRDSGSGVPFMEGATFFEGIAVMVPRFIFSEKPDMSTGNWTGQIFGFVDESDLITNVSPTWFGEFYMNFGIAGLLVGSLILGWFSRRIDASVFAKGVGVRWLMVVFFMNIMWLESFIGMTVLVFVRQMFVFTVQLLLLSKLDRFVSLSNRSRAR